MKLVMIRNFNGTFKRIHKKWSLKNFNDGYISRGRMYCYMPNHHRSNKMGYVQRNILAYEKYYNDIVTKKYAIHHINENKLDDSKKNLIKVKFGEHTALHRRGKPSKHRVSYMNKKFGRLIVIKEVEKDYKNRRYFICKCVCGNITNKIRGDILLSGMSKSCGCLQKEIARESSKKARLILKQKRRLKK